jgi:peptidoglycan-N-acetylglucosamine deacetylase
MNVTLTFDNGPDREVTPRVLDVLDRRGVRAHFFVLGKHVATPAGAELVARAHAAGHLIGNHSYHHAVPLGDDLGEDAVAREIVATQALLEPLVPGARRFRPFGGGGAIGPHLLSAPAAAHLIAERYTCVLWNAVPRDWEDPDGWAARALDDLAARDHTVVVLHDVAGACLAGLDAFVRGAQARGARLVLDVPVACTPIVDGRVVGELAPLVRAAGAA